MKMRRKSLGLLLIAAMVAGLVAMDAPVQAKKGGGGGKPPGMGKTCAELPDAWDKGTPNGDGTYTAVISMDGYSGVCVDVPGVPAGDWTVSWDITTSGQATVKGLLFEIKDSHPGDVCWSHEELSPSPSGTVTAVGIPAAAVDACGSDYLDSAESLVFLALRDAKARRGGSYTINLVLTPPEL